MRACAPSGPGCRANPFWESKGVVSCGHHAGHETEAPKPQSPKAPKPQSPKAPKPQGPKAPKPKSLVAHAVRPSMSVFRLDVMRLDGMGSKACHRCHTVTAVCRIWLARSFLWHCRPRATHRSPFSSPSRQPHQSIEARSPLPRKKVVALLANKRLTTSVWYNEILRRRASIGRRMRRTRHFFVWCRARGPEVHQKKAASSRIQPLFKAPLTTISRQDRRCPADLAEASHAASLV
jgi:hypothetical protein